MSENKANKKGFTLVEVICVTTALGLLASIWFFHSRGVLQHGHAVTEKALIVELNKQVELIQIEKAESWKSAEEALNGVKERLKFSVNLNDLRLSKQEICWDEKQQKFYSKKI